MAVAALAGLAIAAVIGCGSSTEELAVFVDALQRVPLGAEQGVTRFALGFPTRFTADDRTWWYLRPEPSGTNQQNGAFRGGNWLSALIRFDERKRVVERELVQSTATDKPATYRLYAERLSSQDPAHDGVDFASVLAEKLAELAATSDRYTFTRQEASSQLLVEDVLLLSMDRWTRPGSHLVNVRGEFDAEAHPQVREAIDVAWQIRRFAIGLDFEPAQPEP